MKPERAILDIIPHRAPFLFVDEIEEIADGRIRTRMYIDPAADFFRGHYPDQPVMPGVLLCECCFQAGAILVAHRIGGYDPSAGIPVLTRIGDAKFKRIVRPGETVHVETVLDDVLDEAYFLSARATVDGKTVLTVSFACMLARESDGES